MVLFFLMLYLISFIAWILTVFTPCVLPILPLILGSSLATQQIKKTLTIIVSFMISTIIFTFGIHYGLVKSGISLDFLKTLALGIMILYGIFMIFPTLREHIASRFHFSKAIQKFQTSSSGYQELFLGISLGPLFNTCSPTYAFILALILPQHLASGIISIVLYVLGIGMMLFAISAIGIQSIKSLTHTALFRLPWKKILWSIIIIIAIGIFFNIDKMIGSWILDQGWYTIAEYRLIQYHLQP